MKNYRDTISADTYKMTYLPLIKNTTCHGLIDIVNKQNFEKDIKTISGRKDTKLRA